MVNPNIENPNHILFVIDTNSYAGNFERQLCAYVTGQVGECGVGEENAGLARSEVPAIVSQLENLVELVPDEHGCARPVSIFPNPRYGNDGRGNHELITETNKERLAYPAYYSVAIFLHSVPDSKILEVMKERAKAITNKGVGTKGHEQKVEIEGFRLLEQQVKYKELQI